MLFEEILILLMTKLSAISCILMAKFISSLTAKGHHGLLNFLLLKTQVDKGYLLLFLCI